MEGALYIKKMERIKFSVIIFILIFISLLAPVLLFGEYDYRYAVDWEKSKLTVTGYSEILPQETGNYIDWQYRAVLDAGDKLWENFFRSLKDIRIDAFRRSSDILSANFEINKQIYNFLSNNKKNKLIYLSNAVKVVKTFDFYGKNGFATYFVIPGSDRGNFPDYREYVFSTDFSGLVIDARGLGKVPAVAPRIFDEDHNLVYGADFVDSEDFKRWGLVQYTDDPYYKDYIDRVGKNPFRTVALHENKLVETDIEISNEDARVLLQSVITRKNLEKCRVIIVLDSNSLKRIFK